MICRTEGILLHNTRFGETSVITKIFTRAFGLQSYIINGVRTSRTRSPKMALLQSGNLLDLVVYQKQNAGLQRIKEINLHFHYQSTREDMIKNCISLFSVEVLLRLLIPNAPHPELYDISKDYFLELDKNDSSIVANYPLYFLWECCKQSGFHISDIAAVQLSGKSNETGAENFSTQEIEALLYHILQCNQVADVHPVQVSGTLRFAVIEWFIHFLRQHTEHMSQIKSLPVLRAILH